MDSDIRRQSCRSELRPNKRKIILLNYTRKTQLDSRCFNCQSQIMLYVGCMREFFRGDLVEAFRKIAGRNHVGW